METAPAQLLTGNPNSLFDVLLQPTSPSSSAASGQALSDLQHNVQQLKQQLISTAEQSVITALLQLTEPGASLHEPIQQCQQQITLSDKHCQLVHEWELHKAAAWQQRLEIQQLSEDNLAHYSTAQHAHHAEQNTIEGWLYSQYQQLVTEAQDITRDQNRSQAESAGYKQPTLGLKLCSTENKGSLGVHELQLLCGQWHFQAQNEKAKYDALRDRYILLQQAYRALEEKLERTAAVTACQEGFDACHAVKNPVYSVPTAEQGVQTDAQSVEAQLEVMQQQWQGAQQVVEKLVEASSVRMQLQVAEAAAEHPTPEVALRDASLTTDGSNAWNFMPLIKQLQQHMQLQLATAEPTIQMSPLPQPQALTPRPKSPFERQPSPLVSTDMLAPFLAPDQEQELTPAGPSALIETPQQDADSVQISAEATTVLAEQQSAPFAPSALLDSPLLGRNLHSMLEADIVDGQEAATTEAASAEPQVLAIPADLARVPGIDLGLIDLDSTLNLLEPWTGFNKPTLLEAHISSAAAAVVPTEYERDVFAWLDSHPTVSIRELATAACEAAEEAEVMAWLDSSLCGSVKGGCDDGEDADTNVPQAGSQSPDCLGSDDELVPVTADLMQRLSQANSTIEAQQSDLASLQAQNALLKQQVEQQQALLDELTQSEEAGGVPGEAQVEGSGGVGCWGGEADEEVTGPASRKLVTC